MNLFNRIAIRSNVIRNKKDVERKMRNEEKLEFFAFSLSPFFPFSIRAIFMFLVSKKKSHWVTFIIIVNLAIICRHWIIRHACEKKSRSAYPVVIMMRLKSVYIYIYLLLMKFGLTMKLALWRCFLSLSNIKKTILHAI